MNWIEEIKSYIPCNEQEECDKNFILKAINKYDNILTRENIFMHITSSGYIVNKAKDKTLMIHHNIYKSWAWTGGHADGDDDLLHVAIKEAKEETGVKHITPIDSCILSLDILPVNGHFKRGKYVSSHLHLSIAYLLEADENDILMIKEDENSGVKWIPLNELHLHCNEPHMLTVYDKFNSKIF